MVARLASLTHADLGRLLVPRGGKAPSGSSGSASAGNGEAKPQLKSLQIWQKDDYNTYPVAKMLEEKTGYKVQYDMLPQDKPQDKLNLLIASGEPYDAITTGEEAISRRFTRIMPRKGHSRIWGP
ncbi:hypothetical protein LJK88_39845 [Paenibacillus sp. P26]|nr:hypothetical protein LJK88_39845 [Paenibacillus sp. P26]